MKTHPESIFARKSDLIDLADGGTTDLWSSRDELPELSMTVEFVPASALLRERKLQIDQDRDESTDVGIHEGFDQMRPWAEVGEDYRFDRYVPFSHLCAATKLASRASEQLQKQTETMLALRAFVERIANDSGRCTAPDIAPSELYSLICEAQDLLLKVTR